MESKAPQDKLIGTTLGNVKLVEVIGRGGMGTVYKAEHSSLKTPYAVKILHEKYSGNGEVLERFRREAMACSRLYHPNIVYVTDFGFHRDVGLYLVMEYLTGQHLQSLTQSAPAHKLPLWRVVSISEQLCDAFDTAHNAGVIHRDLKPENIWLVPRTSGRDLVKVLDFGIARLNMPLDEDDEDFADLTRQNHLLGTPHYVSPEQIQGSRKVTPQTDIYALGVLMYEMIAGQPPFDTQNLMQLLTMHVRSEPPLLSTHRAELAKTQIEQLIMQMLAKRPEDRPGSMAAIGGKLPSALQELQERGIPDANPKPIPTQMVDIGTTGRSFATTGPFRLTGLLHELKGDPQATRLARLYRALPALNTLPVAQFFLATWGSILRDLLDSDLDSDTFKQTLIHLATILEGFLTTVETGEDIQEMQHLIQHAIQELMVLSAPERQKQILTSFQHLTTHYLFPQYALPEWAQPQTGGTWKSIKGVLTTDIRELFRSADKDDASTPPPATAAAPNVAPPSNGPISSNEPNASLADKLKQDVSLQSIKSLLTHEIRLFKRKKKQEEA